nr:MAG: hypothetical protein [Caudoviricetes sp.]
MTMIDDLLSVITSNQDGWALNDLDVYVESGHVNSDLQPYLDWWYGDRDDLPTPGLGSLNCFEGMST